MATRTFQRLIISSLTYCALCSAIELTENLKILEWFVGKWRSDFDGKLVWPTVPTMNYGEELEIYPAPFSESSATHFLNFTAKAWSHSTRDHFHDEYGFITVSNDGEATLLTTGNNGFATVEKGYAGYGTLSLKLQDIGRIAIARDLPVEDIVRQFRLVDSDHLEQVLLMRTATHPSDKYSVLEHARITYKRIGNATVTRRTA